MKDQYREPHTKVQLQLGDKQEEANVEVFRLIKTQEGGKSTPTGALFCPSRGITSQTNDTEQCVSLELKCAGPSWGLRKNLLHRTTKGEKGHNFFLPP